MYSGLKKPEQNIRSNFQIMKDIVTIMLDTSGEGLHKRGYRANANIAAA
jgi:putative N6-adenine-specific DNA methylase